jgi:NAD(P)-dependent dehydrogenase (short-subunit alcohol dehydrogenase family)
LANIKERLDLSGRVVVITGAAGLLGREHAAAVAELGATPVLLDIDEASIELASDELARSWRVQPAGFAINITDAGAVQRVADEVMARYGRIDGLINNAANNPKMESGQSEWSRLENFPIDVWNADIAVGVTGAFLCARAFGAHMAAAGAGSIVNVASDLGVIAPDQRIYRTPGRSPQEQPVKPVTYSVVKHALIGLTKYLATYWAESNVRVNALSPGGVFNGQDDAFVQRLTNLIPLGRMADRDEYRGAIAFLISDASSYMTGANLIVDGGRTTW